jgi:type II secretory ATPase GspE/PulE/Tfp pilus assembly ATPase PilB-like protein
MSSPSNSQQPEGAYDVVGLVEDLLSRASAAEASDIHFERLGGQMLVRFRLDGVLKTVETVPGAIAENVVARLKVLAGLLTYRNDIPQEGRLEHRQGDDRILDRRLAVFPTIDGQRAVVRLFRQESALEELDSLGFLPQDLADLKSFAAQPQGLLLLTGPAGSGKSTTLGAILRHILRLTPGRSILTLEDPVERRLEGIPQVQISAHGGMTFPTALRSLLRQDPEVLMIGEIRDAETAGIVVEAALSGHLLMSTMHSGSPAGGLLRLMEMGLEPYQITASLSAVVSQRLVRMLCGRCRRQDAGAWKAVGCPHCLGTGFKGRRLVAEMVRMDGALRQAVLAKADLSQLEGILRQEGHQGLRGRSQPLADEGVTTSDELDKVCGPLG